MPDVSRRTLLLGAGVLGIAGLAAPITSAQDASAQDASAQRLSGRNGQLDVALDVPSRSHFVPGLGERFQATGGSGTYALDLVDILDVVPAAVGDPERSFNLIFAAAGEAAPTEGVYRVSTTAVPAVDLFLSPVGGQTRRRELQALVNRSA